MLLLIQINETANSAYQILVDATTIIYFMSLLYMYAAAIKLAYRKDRGVHPNAVLIPGGKFGVWLAGSLGFVVVLAGIALSLIPPGGVLEQVAFRGQTDWMHRGVYCDRPRTLLSRARAKSREERLQITLP